MYTVLWNVLWWNLNESKRSVLNQQSWLSHNAALHGWWSFTLTNRAIHSSKFGSVNHYPREKKKTNDLGPVARSLVSANRWLRGIKMYRFPWYLTLVSTNHASSNLGLGMTKHCRNHRIHWQKKIDFSYSDSGGTLENKLNDLKPLFSRKNSFAFQKMEGKSCWPE